MTINTDILHRLDRLIQLVSGKTYPDDACCHCDQSVGYTCDICAELAMLCLMGDGMQSRHGRIQYLACSRPSGWNCGGWR